jgi:hypothetical protein
MNNLKSIEDLIKVNGMTKQEINYLDDFIEDARQQKTLNDAYAAYLFNEEMNLKESLYRLCDIFEELADKVKQIANDMEADLLIKIPESSLYWE